MVTYCVRHCPTLPTSRSSRALCDARKAYGKDTQLEGVLPISDDSDRSPERTGLDYVLCSET